MNNAISYLQVENISKSYGEVTLFHDLSFGINKDQNIALIARNGIGKTSLLNIIAGVDEPDTGKISTRNGITISYLEQSPTFNPENSVLEQVLESSNEIVQVIRKYQDIIHSNDNKLLEEIMGEMDALQAWDYEVKIKQILNHLKIFDLSKKIKHLSGGQLKRIALANSLINEPDLLILDEPTNHLDLEMIEWLEIYLKSSKSTLLMVTHDRYFLNRICNEIIELDNNTLYTYSGNYDYFLEKRELRINSLNSSIDRAQNLLRKELDWMRRSPKARTTKAKSRIDAFYNLEEKASQNTNVKQVNINVQSTRLGKKILELHYINKSFDNTVLIKDFNYKFTRGEKIGLIGKNGSGKSTLLNIITQSLKPDSGKIEIGETVNYGYYRQEGIQFKEDQRLIDVVREVAEVVILGDGKKLSIRQFLNYFLFPNEMHHHQIAKLSGGERRRLYLMIILMKKPNFLILDEPTNDLDIMTLNVLEEYLISYTGCVLIVSHDRFFMDKIVDHLFVFKENGQIKDFPGNYSVYKTYKSEQELIDKKILKKEISITKPTKLKTKKIFSYKEKREYELLVSELEELNSEKELLETEITSNTLKTEVLISKSSRLGEVINLLDEKELRWLELDELMST